MRSSPTMRVALRDFAANHVRHSDGGVVYPFAKRDHAFFGYAVYQPAISGLELICDGAPMAAFNYLNELVGAGSGVVSSVELSRAEPFKMAPYRASFGVKPTVIAKHTAVVFPRRLLDQPLAEANCTHHRNLGMMWWEELMRNLASGFYLCAVFGCLTVVLRSCQHPTVPVARRPLERFRAQPTSMSLPPVETTLRGKLLKQRMLSKP
jgi:hypothetical protein